MEKNINIAERKLIWIALSEFYLDTELQDADFKRIANLFKESPYDIAQIKQIDKYEVFPVLQINLLNVAGEWAGFNEEWLVDTIQQKMNKQNLFKRRLIDIYYYCYKWMHKDHWEQIEKAYSFQLKN